jgi:pimeloyl-ACP methyl ester carboxylesterase
MVAAMRAATPITESRVEVDGVGILVRRTEGEGPPVVFAHGNPTDSRDWLSFMERTTRPSIGFDHPGWGGSDAPSPKEFDYSMHGLARFFGRALDALEVGEHALVVHDWGGLALIDELARPGRLERLVVINTVPLLPGYRWHRLAIAWRTPGLGPLVNRAIWRPGLRLESRRASGDGKPLPDWFIDLTQASWRAASSDAILGLYRSADPPKLAAAGHGLGAIECPALVAWGLRDPYLPPRFGRAYAGRLPNAELLELPDAGHWPWIDRPDLISTVVEFLRIRKSG